MNGDCRVGKFFSDRLLGSAMTKSGNKRRMSKTAARQRKKHGLSIHVKVWIEDNHHELIVGMGRVAMIEAIERTGSLNQAARELNMSYRALWERLRRTEKRLGKKLLVRTTGGKEGGGSELTPLAKSIIENFRELNSELENEAAQLFELFSRKFLKDYPD